MTTTQIILAVVLADLIIDGVALMVIRRSPVLRARAISFLGRG